MRLQSLSVQSPLFERVSAELVTVAITLAVSFFPFVASEFVSAFAIPSRSMDATLQIGDVVLAEKLSSRLQMPLERGDLVFFSPPQELQEIVLNNGGRLGQRDRFVKRIAAVAGDVVEVDQSGRSVRINNVLRAAPALACREEPLLAREPFPSLPGLASGSVAVDPSVDPEVQESVRSLLTSGRIDEGEAAALLREVAPPKRETAEGAVEQALSTRRSRVFGNVEARAVDPQQLGARTTVPDGFVFVLGDCEARSTDSRVWGPLAVDRIVARPVVRIWPLERSGPVETTADLNPFRREAVRFRRRLNQAVFWGVPRVPF